MKKSKLSKLRSKDIPLPKTDLKKEREARQRASDALRKSNREYSLKLDKCTCRNPFCSCSQINTMDTALIDSHHILGKTKDNRYDGVEYRISLSRRCHTKYDKDRVGMIKILKRLRKTVPDFRWRKALKELVERYG